MYFCYFFILIRNDNLNGSVDVGYIQLERDILTPLAGSGKLYVLQVCFQINENLDCLKIL